MSARLERIRSVVDEASRKEARERQRKALKDESGPLPIDVQVGSAARMLAAPPPPENWLIEGFIPDDICGGLVAHGGAGKTFLLMQLGVSVATGSRFFGKAVSQPGGVLMLTAEECQATIARRLHAIAAANGFDKWRDEWHPLCQNLHVVSVAGRDNRLTATRDGNVVVQPQAIGRIIEAADEISSPRLIVLDPLSRFRSGDENQSEPATRIVEAMEIIRQATSATVLVAHHARKGGGEGADAIRGSSALVDGLRWAATLTRPDAEAAKRFGLDDDDRRALIRMDVVKSNARIDVPEMWLRRGAGGALEYAEAPKPVPSASQAQKGEERYRETLPKLKDLVRREAEKGRPLSMRRLRDYAGSGGVFGMGRPSLVGIVERAIAESEIVRREDGELHLW